MFILKVIDCVSHLYIEIDKLCELCVYIDMNRLYILEMIGCES